MRRYTRLIVALVLSAAAACGGDKVMGPPVVATVELTPAADTLTALGLSRQFTAVARDPNGRAITGKTFTWSTSAASVVSVDAGSGVATAVANGQATITAQVDGQSAGAIVTVAQAVASLAVTPASATTTALASTQQYSVVAKDANGNPIANAPTVWLSSNHNVATIDATGLATSTGPGTATITAAVQGIPGTASFIVNQVATQLAITVPPTSASAGQSLSPAVQVEIRDANGARAVLARDAVTLGLGANPGAGTLGGTKTVNAVAGVATFSGLTVDKVGAGYTLATSSGALAGATSAAFDITPAAAARLAVTAQPSSGMAGTVITPAVQVAVQDAFGNTVPGATTAVTVALSGNPGGATLAGTATQTAVNGVATFSDLSLRGGGSDYTLTATAPGLASAASAAFNMVPVPSVASFTAAQNTVTSGAIAVLTPVFGGGTGTIDHGIGAVTSGQAVSTGALTATTTYTLTVTNSLGTSQTGTVSVTVVPAPTITSLTAGQATITSGTGTTLTPVFSGGAGAIDHDVGAVTSGTAVSTGLLTSGTTFTLTVTNAAGTSVTATVPVGVASAPTIISFGAAQGTITSGASTSLTAVFAGGTGTINQGLGAATSGTGISTGALTATTTYTLTVTNAAGASVTATVPVTVVAAPSIASFTAAQGVITAGTNALLLPVFSGGVGTIDHGVGAVTTGSTDATAALTVATTFTLTVTNAAGTSVTATVLVGVVSGPSVTGFVTGSGTNVVTITSGTSTTLTAVFDGPTGTIDHGIGTVMSGVAVSTGALTATTTFTLTVANGAGASTSALVTVVVVPAPSIVSFGAASTTVSSGTNALLTPIFTDGTGTIDHGVGPVTSGQAVSAGVTTTGATTFSLTVTNAAGTSITTSVSVLVVAAPSIASFSAAQGTVTQGESTNLAAVFSGGTATFDADGGPISMASGVPVSTGALSTVGDRQFHVTVANAAGATVTATVLVSVVPPPAISGMSITGPSVVNAGTVVPLTVNFSGGTGSIDHGIGAVTSGMTIGLVPEVGTTLFTLTVTNAAGTSLVASVLITVIAPPTIASFTAAPATITSGTSTTLTATFAGGTGLLNGTTPVTSGVPVPTGALGGTTFFSLTVTNAVGASVTMAVTVTVVDPPSIAGFSATPTVLTSGSHTTLSPVFSGGVGTVDHGVGTVASGIQVATGAPTLGTTTFTLTVTNAAGTSVSVAASVDVIPPPVIMDFNPMQGTITTGTGTGLVFLFGGGVGVIDHGIGPVTSGVPVPTGSLTATTTYTLTVTNAAGTSVTAPLTVTVVAAPSITSFTLGADSVTSGTGTTLNATFTGGTGVINGIGPITSGVPLATGDGLPLGTTTFTLTVTNAAGASVTDTVSVTVIDAPSISVFIASPDTVASGSTSNVGALFTGGTATVDHGVGPITAGTYFPTGVLTTTTTFTVTVTNVLGATATATVTVTVI